MKAPVSLWCLFVALPFVVYGENFEHRNRPFPTKLISPKTEKTYIHTYIHPIWPRKYGIFSLQVFIPSAFLPLLPALPGDKCHQMRLFCPRNVDEVCGTDDVTYGNKCILEEEACKVGKRGLKVAHKGKCQEEGKREDEGSEISKY